MIQDSSLQIIDITNNPSFRNLLIGCIFHRKKEISYEQLYLRNKERGEYLKEAIPKGYHMKILFHNNDHVGMIEYGPPEASGLPILGKNIIVMNCIWVMSYARGNNFGRLLLNDMINSETQTEGFATLALENYWIAWMGKDLMESLGFKSINQIKLRHKKFNIDQCFTAHLMWLRNKDSKVKPSFDEVKILNGISFCNSHPLYWGKYNCKKSGLHEIYTKC